MLMSILMLNLGLTFISMVFIYLHKSSIWFLVGHGVFFLYKYNYIQLLSYRKWLVSQAKCFNRFKSLQCVNTFLKSLINFG